MVGINRREFLGGAAAAPLLTLPGIGRALAEDSVLKVAIIHTAPESDTGWEADQKSASDAMEAAFPGRIKLTPLWNIFPQQDNERLFRQLANQDNKLIFGTSFSQYATLKKLAPTFPGTRWECCAGIEATNNLGIFEARAYEGSYVTGIAAARMTKSNILGWVGALPVPQVIYSLNGFVQGARSVNPNIVCKVVWANAWIDPAKEKDAVAALAAQGADVISGNPNTPVQGLAAEAKGIWSIGSSGDFSRYVKKAQLTSFVFDWSPAYIEAVQAVLDGSWKPQSRWRGLGKGGFCKMSTNSPDLPEKVVAEMKVAEEAIAAGKLHPFAGPLKDQTGKQRVAAGAVLADDQIKAMNWLVEGVQGSLSNGG